MLSKFAPFWVVMSLVTRVVSGQETAAPPDTLTRAVVVQLAGERASTVLEADLALAESRARLAAARVLSIDNPSVEVLTSDTEEEGRRTSMELSVPVGFGFKRSGRVRFAKAEAARDELLSRDARRLAVGRALEAWYAALHSERREALAREQLSLSEELARTVEERFRSGDAARLDVNVAAMELSRARSDALVETQNRVAARAELEDLLGLPHAPDQRLRGDLADRSLFEGLGSEFEPAGRVDVTAAERRIEAARAEKALARTHLLPDMAFRLNYEDLDGRREWMPGVALVLPLFNRGQGSGALADARRNLAVRDLERKRARSAAEFEIAKTGYRAAVEAVEELERNGLERAAEVEGMAGESYRAGKIDLASMLLLRRGVVEVRRDHVDRLLDAALQGVRLLVSTGVMP
jgi:cobalt-zinc-cadmium efflux system outer membrane protein